MKYKGGSIAYTIERVGELVERAGYSLLSNAYKNRDSKITIRCKQGHTREMTFGNFQKKILKGNQCKQCFANILRLDFGVFIKEAKKRGHTILSKAQEYKTAKSKIRIKCQDGHIFSIGWDDYRKSPERSKRSNGCKECSRIKNSLSGNVNALTIAC